MQAEGGRRKAQGRGRTRSPEEGRKVPPEGIRKLSERGKMRAERGRKPAVEARRRSRRRRVHSGRPPTGATSAVAELSVFFFTPSGSEANELALRLVRKHTGHTDLCVMDHGYHGHTTSTMAMSPYKFRQPGAPAKPDWVHVTVQPDVYRGTHKGDDAGTRYAAEVAETIASLQQGGRQLAGYLCECLPSVGGQLELPADFLSGVYGAVRRAGGLCIADDVQTGLWRTGTHAFGFEKQQVVPDLLVLGKPLGNGFPRGCVVTTKEVAASVADGPEFFSTFGGSTAGGGVAVGEVAPELALAIARLLELPVYAVVRFVGSRKALSSLATHWRGSELRGLRRATCRRNTLQQVPGHVCAAGFG